MDNSQIWNGKVLTLIGAIAVVVIVGFYMISKNSMVNAPSPRSTATQTNGSIQNDKDLTNASKNLDNTNIDSGIDSALQQNDSDMATF